MRSLSRMWSTACLPWPKAVGFAFFFCQKWSIFGLPQRVFGLDLGDLGQVLTSSYIIQHAWNKLRLKQLFTPSFGSSCFLIWFNPDQPIEKKAMALTPGGNPGLNPSSLAPGPCPAVSRQAWWSSPRSLGSSQVPASMMPRAKLGKLMWSSWVGRSRQGPWGMGGNRMGRKMVFAGKNRRILNDGDVMIFHVHPKYDRFM